VSGISLASRAAFEVEAAHVVALSDGGADEPRNGFTLTGTLHWAFDQGLFMIGANRRVFVPPQVRGMKANQWLSQFHERPITEAKSKELRTASEAFEVHRKKFSEMWS
jgi:putative restriction endonuclease